MPEDYTYETAGFDEFMSRSIDEQSIASLDAPSPLTVQAAVQAGGGGGEAFDGDILKLGNIEINGLLDQIRIYEGNNIRVLIGKF